MASTDQVIKSLRKAVGQSMEVTAMAADTMVQPFIPVDTRAMRKLTLTRQVLKGGQVFQVTLEHGKGLEYRDDHFRREKGTPYGHLRNSKGHMLSLISRFQGSSGGGTAKKGKQKRGGKGEGSGKRVTDFLKAEGKTSTIKQTAGRRNRYMRAWRAAKKLGILEYVDAEWTKILNDPKSIKRLSAVFSRSLAKNL